MPAKKSGKRSGLGRKRNTGAGTARKTVAKAAKRISTGAAKMRKSASRAAAATTKRAKKAASNPRQAVRKAATSVHETATRARGLGDSVVSAGELIKETADFVDAIARRAKSRRGAAGKTSKTR